jgi:hypothetical protein
VGRRPPPHQSPPHAPRSASGRDRDCAVAGRRRVWAGGGVAANGRCSRGAAPVALLFCALAMLAIAAGTRGLQ